MPMHAPSPTKTTMTKPTLNVGVGPDPKRKYADYAVDMAAYDHVDVVADARHLPFKESSFRRVFMHAILEHVFEWKAALDDAVRVSEVAEITVPHYSSGQAYDPEHVAFFNKMAFRDYDHRLEFHWSGRGSNRRIYTRVINALVTKAANFNLNWAEKWCYYVGGFEEMYAEVWGTHDRTVSGAKPYTLKQ